MLFARQDRRTRRSDNCCTALRFQLESALERGRMEALALSDSSGLLLAWAGEKELSEEVGALAPIMSHCPMGTLQVSGTEGQNVFVQPIDYFGQRIYLSCVGGGLGTKGLLARSAQGVQRILTAN